MRRDTKIIWIRSHQSGGDKGAHAVPVRRHSLHVDITQPGENIPALVGSQNVGVAGADFDECTWRTHWSVAGVGVVGRDRNQSPVSHYRSEVAAVRSCVA